MTDKLTKEKRSWNMSRVRNKDTSLELKVRRYLYERGLRYRLHLNIVGKPDISFPKKRIAIFINGCFWHSHESCKLHTIPKSNVEFWSKKLSDNVVRDTKKHTELESLGWKVLIIWECEIKDEFEKVMSDLYDEVTGIKDLYL